MYSHYVICSVKINCMHSLFYIHETVNQYCQPNCNEFWLTRDSILRAFNWDWPLTFKLFCVQRQIKLLQQRKKRVLARARALMTIAKNSSTASPKLTSMTFPRKIHFSLLVFYTLSRGKKSTPCWLLLSNLFFFSLGPVVGKRKNKISTTSSRFEWTKPTFKT